MQTVSVYVLCLAYVVGLLVTGLPDIWHETLFPGWTAARLMIVGWGAIAALVMPRQWRMGPKATVWVLAGLIAIGAGFYLQERSPTYEQLMQPTPLQQHPTFPLKVELKGHILDSPRLTRSQSVRFQLRVNTIQLLDSGSLDTGSGDTPSPTLSLAGLKPVTHVVDVTVPLLQGTGLYPGEQVKVEGRLDRPHVATTPGAFNYRRYLERQGIFTRLNASRIQISHHSPAWMIGQAQAWAMRRRIIRSFVRGLDSPAGPLLSAMVLGRKAVDLPYEIQDQFIQAGLAHILAASGFHVSLLLGLVLTLGRFFTPAQKLGLGSVALIGYVSLTGIQPSVCRAALMGFAVLVAAVLEQKIRPLGALLLIATLLLAIHPQWIWDLGFQLSFLATVGLVVTVPVLMTRLDWLPPAIASMVAVPIAALIWTLPILLRTMGTVLPYSPIVSGLTTLWIVVISLGGMVAGAIALLLPAVGSAIASILYWPIHGLIAAVIWCNQLPGQAIALGTLTTLQLILIYGLYALMSWTGLSTRWRWRLSPRWLMGIILVGLVVIPMGYARYQKVQITILSPSRTTVHLPLMVVQNRGTVGLINSGTESDIQYRLLPFLRHQGINRVDWAIATRPVTRSVAAWYQLATTIPIRQLYEILPPGSEPESERTGNSPASQKTQHQRTPNHSGELDLALEQAVSIATFSKKQSFKIGPRSTLTVLPTRSPILQLVIDDHDWLIIDGKDTDPNRQDGDRGDHSKDRVNPDDTVTALADNSPIPVSDIWYWTDAESTVLPAHLPQDALVTTSEFPTSDGSQPGSSDRAIDHYQVAENSVLQWTPKAGFLEQRRADDDKSHQLD